MDELVKSIYRAAEPFQPCKLFNGSETFEEMIRKFLTPQGIEFCTKHDFLSKAHLQAIKERVTPDTGVMIDKGRISLCNPRKIVLVGDTDADIEFDTLEYACRVVLMKGAKARITARGYSVVAIDQQDGCSCGIKAYDNAVVR